MHKYFTRTIGASMGLLIGLLVCTSPLFAQNNLEKSKTHIRVKFKPSAVQAASSMSKTTSGYIQTDISTLNQLHQAYQVKSMKRVFPYAGKFEEKHKKYGLHLWYDLEFEQATATETAITDYLADAAIALANPAYEYRLDYTGEMIESNDPRLRDQWHYDNTGQSGGSPDADVSLFDAWDLETGDTDVIVSVHDSGIDTDHPDLVDVLWTNTGEIPNNGIDDDNNGYIDDVHGFNFWNNTGNVEDFNGHGTHTAGTVAAKNNNNYGVAGVAGGLSSTDGVQIMVMRLGDDAGSNAIFNPAPSFIYAADMGSTISSNSWGGGSFDQALVDAMNYYTAEAQNSQMQGGLIIFSAGNSSSSATDYKSNYDNVMMVAATNHRDERSWYSNYGSWIDLSAPGGETNSRSVEGVLSTIPGNAFAYFQGTSMACPHVSGVAALVTSRAGGPNFTNSQLFDILVNATDEIDEFNPSFRGQLGSGRINALKALESVDPTGGGGVSERISITPGSFEDAITFDRSKDYAAKILNNSNVDLLLEFNTGSDWISLDEPEVRLAKGAVYNLQFTVATGSSAPGNTLEGNIVVDFGSQQQIIPVKIDVISDPQISVVDTLRFDKTLLNRTSTSTLTISNIGFDLLKIDSVKLSDSQFSLGQFPGEIAPSSIVDLSADFTPTNTGLQYADLQIYSNDPDTPVKKVVLAGEGNGNKPPTVALSANGINIKQNFPTYDQYLLLIQNTGEENLEVSLSEVPIINELPDTIPSAESVQRYRVLNSNQANGPVFNWLDISKVGDSITFDANKTHHDVTLSDVYLFGEEFLTDLSISRWGYITFGGDPNASNVWYLTYSGSPIRSIVPYWSSTGADENTKVYYLDLADKFIVQYNNFTSSDADFQIILFKDGNVLFQYLNIPESNEYISVGLKGSESYNGLSVGYDRARDLLEDNYAIHFSTGLAISWFSPASSIIAPGDVQQFRLDYNGYNVATGIKHQSLVRIENNSDDPVIDIPFSLEVSGSSSIQLSQDVNFGEVFIGSDAKSVFSIKNPGTDTLKILGIDNTSSLVSVGTYPEFLLRGQEVLVEVVLNTSSLGAINDVITINSNARFNSTTSLNVSAQVNKAPVISTDAAAITATIYEGEIYADSFSISNSAADSQLEFNISSALQSTTNTDALNNASILLGFSVNTSNVTDTLTAKGAIVSFSSSFNITDEQLSQTDLIVFDRNLRNLAVSDLTRIQDWIRQGGAVMINLEDYGERNNASNLLQGSGIFSSRNYSYGNITSFTNHEINEGVDLLRANSRDYITNVDETATLIARNTEGNGFAAIGTIGAGRVMLVTANIFRYTSNPGNQRFALNAIDWLLKSRSISVTPPAGTINGQEELNVDIMLNQNGRIPAGSYSWDMVIDHNDPSQESYIVPVSLEVNSTGIVNTQEEIDFSETLIGRAGVDFLSITNTGSDSLLIENLAVDNDRFMIVLDSAEFPMAIAPKEVSEFLVLFIPEETGEQQANLSITSNSKSSETTTVKLSGEGINSVLFSAVDEAIYDTVDLGEELTTTFSIENKGSTEGAFIVTIEDRGVANAIAEIRQQAMSTSSVLNLNKRDLNGGTVNVELTGDQIAGTISNIDPTILLDVAILGSGPYFTNLVDSLSAYSQFSSLSYIDVGITTPTVNQLLNFDAVFVYTTFGYQNRFTLGDNLAAYVDAGGGVVHTPVNFASFSGGLQGNWVNGDYQLMAGNNATNNTSTATTFPESPITEVITNVTANFRLASNSLVNDGNILSRWSDDLLLIAEKPIGEARRVDLGIYPEAMFYNFYPESQEIKLMLNALTYVGSRPGQSEVPWISLDTYEGTLAGGSQYTFQLNYSTENLREATYLANINVRSNDSEGSEINIPVTLQTKGVPALEYENELAFGEVSVGFEETLAFDLFNNGTGSASLDSVYVSDTIAFSIGNIENLPDAIRRGQTGRVLISFAPTTVKSYDEVLTLVLDGVPVTIPLKGTALAPGSISVNKESISLTIDYQDATSERLEISNVGDGPLSFEISQTGDNRNTTTAVNQVEKLPSEGATGIVTASSGTDAYGYSWYDSDSSALDFQWQDISANANAVQLNLSDDSAQKVELPFSFRLYDDLFSTVYIGSNGFLTVNEDLSNSPSYSLLPTNNGPSGIIAPFWSDLNPEAGGTIYYEIGDGQLIVQYNDISTFDGLHTLTFQAILSASGEVVFNYLSVSGATTGTVGLADEANRNALNIAFNDDYLKSELSVLITPPEELVSIDIKAGVLAPGTSQKINLSVNTGDLLGGIYQQSLVIESNDSASSVVEIPIEIRIVGEPQLALEADTLTFDSTFVSDISYRELTVTNPGTDLLLIEDIVASTGEFTGPMRQYDFVLNDSTTISGVLLRDRFLLQDTIPLEAYSDLEFFRLVFEQSSLDLVLLERDGNYIILGSLEMDADFVKSLQSESARFELVDGNLDVVASATASAVPIGVPPGRTNNILLYFTPQESGERHTTVTFSGNQAEDQVLTVTGFAESVERSLLVPTELVSEVVSVGDSAQQVVVIKNTGTATVNYSVETSVRRVPSGQNVISDGLDQIEVPDELGFANGFSADTSVENNVENLLPEDIRGSIYGGFYDRNRFPGYGHTFFTLEDVSTQNTIQSFNLSGFSNAGDFVEINGVPHLIEINSSANMITLNLETGDFTFGRAPISALTGMTVDPQTGIIYGTRAGSLYMIDLAERIVVPIGDYDLSGLIVDIAMDDKGNIYGADVSTDALYLINPITAKQEYIGPLGFNSSFGQGMAFNQQDGKIYMSALDDRGTLELREVNTQTGSTTSVGEISRNSAGQMGWLAFPNRIQYVASVKSQFSSLEPGQSDSLRIEFKSKGLFNGTYLGNIVVSSDDQVNPKQSIPWELTVTGNSPAYSKSDDLVDFGNVEIGQTLQRSFSISNSGVAKLDVAISQPTEGFLVADDQLQFSVAILNGTTTIDVRYEPTTLGVSEQYLVINTNDENHPIDSILMRGTGVRGNTRLSLSDDAFEWNIAKNTCDTTYLQIDNIGQDSIHWSLDLETAADWLSLSSNSAGIAAGERSEIALVYCDSNGVPATETRQLIFQSNDPLYDSLVIPVTFSVFNQAPVVEVPEDGAINLGDSVVLELAEISFDADGDSLTYSVNVDNGGIVSYQTSEDQLIIKGLTNGTEVINISASDGTAHSNVASFTLTINAIPHNTVTMEPVSMLVGENRSFDLNEYFSDADGDQLSYEVSYEGASIGTLLSTDGILLIDGYSAGSTTLSIDVSDGQSGIVVEVAVEIKERIELTLDQTAYDIALFRNGCVTSYLNIENVGGDEVTWSLDIPEDFEGLTLSTSSGTIAPEASSEVEIVYCHPAGDVGSFATTLLFRSNDPGHEEVEIPLTALVTNRAPETYTFADVAVNSGEAFTISLNEIASDPDQDQLTYEVIADEALVSVNTTEEAISFTTLDFGTTEVKIVAYDQLDYSDTLHFDLSINAVPTKIDEIEALEIILDNELTIDLNDYVSDADNDVLAFEITYDESLLSAFLSTEGELLIRGTAEGNATITVTASDDMAMVTLEIPFTVLKPLNASEDLATKWQLYPNPATDKITLNLSGLNAQVTQVMILNMSGQQMTASSNRENGLITVDLASLAQGTYLAVVVTEDGREERALFIKK